MTDDEAKAMLAALSEHYKCPVMPVDRYCEALRVWQSALSSRFVRKLGECFPILVRSDADQNTNEAIESRALYSEVLRLHKENRLYSAVELRNDPRLYEFGRLAEMSEEIERVGSVFLQISNSNLLWRLIYQGEELRKEMCPVHKGTWSGYGFDEPYCECQHGFDITGWLPNKPAEQCKEETVKEEQK